MVCGNVTGNSSNNLQGTLKGKTYSDSLLCMMSLCCNFIGSPDCAGAIATASLFAILLAMCVTVLTILVTVLVKNKGNIKFVEIWLARFKKASSVTESTYEDVRHRKQSIDTKKNIAYGKPMTTSTTSDQ